MIPIKHQHRLEVLISHISPDPKCLPIVFEPLHRTDLIERDLAHPTLLWTTEQNVPNLEVGVFTTHTEISSRCIPPIKETQERVRSGRTSVAIYSQDHNYRTKKTQFRKDQARIL